MFINQKPTQLTVMIFSTGRVNLHFLVKGRKMIYQKLQQNNSINKPANISDNQAVARIHYLLS